MRLKGITIERPTEKELILPYQCFACFDTGLIRFLHDGIRNQFIEGDQDLHMVCNRSGCQHGSGYHQAIAINDLWYRNAFDTRFNSLLSQELHDQQLKEFLVILRRSPQERKEIIFRLINELENIKF